MKIFKVKTAIGLNRRAFRNTKVNGVLRSVFTGGLKLLIFALQWVRAATNLRL
jgi:hypothetical protein